MKMTRLIGNILFTRHARQNQHDQHDSTDHMQQPDTDIPGVWKWSVEPKSDLYGDRTGKLMDLENVVRGRLTELKHMNDHHVYDWIDEASIPKRHQDRDFEVV